LGAIYGKTTNYFPRPLLQNALPIVDWWKDLNKDDKKTFFEHDNYINSNYANNISVVNEAKKFISEHYEKNFI
jgi:hypothetical protein